ncbi:hypothetical protein B0H14DRAFT_2626881 [Mycena olivaceomarginata]|nr:hypothetical protein B0H14DRAFT_2626881 [Mycena olivaceomarginata]
MPSAAFCNKPLSTSVNYLSENLGVTLNWILSNGIQAPHSLTSSLLTLPSGDTVCFMQIDLLHFPHALNLSIVDIDTPVSWVMQSESTEYLGFAQFWCQAIR